MPAPLAELIRQSDAILIGAGSGLSSACGYNHYHWTPAFLSYLEAFREKYGFKSPMDGFYYCFPDLESQWGYYAAYINAMWNLPTGSAYQDLDAITRGKDRFFLTTNIDMQADRVFNGEEIRHFQGDVAHLQCRQPCHDELYPSRDRVEEMLSSLDGDLRIPSELVPRCEVCNWPLVPWVRDDTFMEGEMWQKEMEAHRAFIRRHIIERSDRLLLIEIGVGEMTPSIIKLPFWSLAQNNENVMHVCINSEAGSAPLHLGSRSLYIRGDAAEVLSETRRIYEQV